MLGTPRDIGVPPPGIPGCPRGGGGELGAAPTGFALEEVLGLGGGDVGDGGEDVGAVGGRPLQAVPVVDLPLARLLVHVELPRPAPPVVSRQVPGRPRTPGGPACTGAGPTPRPHRPCRPHRPLSPSQHAPRRPLTPSIPASTRPPPVSHNALRQALTPRIPACTGAGPAPRPHRPCRAARALPPSHNAPW